MLWPLDCFAALAMTVELTQQLGVIGQLQKKAPNTLKSLDARLKSALVFRRRIASRGDARLAAGHDETAAVTRLFLGVAQVLFRRDEFPRRRQNHGSESGCIQRRRPPLRRRLAVQRAPLFGRAPERSGVQHNSELIILLSSAMKPSDASGRADRISREIPSANQFPCYLDLIPLLFRCYSAVNSAVNSAVISTVSVGNSSANT